jgi:hypothetical protein
MQPGERLGADDLLLGQVVHLKVQRCCSGSRWKKQARVSGALSPGNLGPSE